MADRDWPMLLRSACDDIIPVLEEILDREDMDYDECLARGDDPLCGSSWCHQCGCIVDKLRRARNPLTVS